MPGLYLKILEFNCETVIAPPETTVCLVVLHCFRYPISVPVWLVHSKDKDVGVPLKVSMMKYSLMTEDELPKMAKFCQLPVLTNHDEVSCVAGLCSVLRQVVKESGNEFQELLGFRESCLVATAEFSLWTKFCEVDLIKCFRTVVGRTSHGSVLPEELASLEVHLSQPVRAHNIGKLKSTEHKFVEGPQLYLSDIIISTTVHVIISYLHCWDCEYIQLTLNWLRTVQIYCEGLAEAFEELLDLSGCTKFPSVYTLPEVSKHSLYKSDPKRYKPRDKIFTQQCDIDDGLRKLSAVTLKTYQEPLGCDIALDLLSIPKPDVPNSRLERKIQQLLNLTKAVLQVSKDKDVIVDFCCGSGHLGLVIAHCLPNCSVLLLDNKEKSLSRAKEKLQTLGLKNVFIIQSNLDYFISSFQVGVSLHACGVASDLVIHKCLANKANFVVCPCCYGNIQINHVVSYPQSQEMREAGLSSKGLIVLGHCADQEGTKEGEKGMLAVDTDRCLAAQSQGYEVTLAKLIPPTCTPRNNLIIAFLPRKSN